MWLKKIRNLILIFLLFFFVNQKIFAASSYVLPYPGLMPGHRLYKIKQIFGRLYRLYVFGSFSLHKYELKLADKKLVEAKILFEYQQYLLALKALESSNFHFQKAVNYLNKAREEGKDISVKMVNLKSAAKEHEEVLTILKKDLPEEFLWQPEKEEAEKLMITESLNESIKIRNFN